MCCIKQTYSSLLSRLDNADAVLRVTDHLVVPGPHSCVQCSFGRSLNLREDTLSHVIISHADSEFPLRTAATDISNIVPTPNTSLLQNNESGQSVWSEVYLNSRQRWDRKYDLIQSKAAVMMAMIS
ncbi:hypothetical protein BaRGS_00014631 [Batillaria attramentaria]|uniref:Uncharacterized protein n=1 Tax=Batillaria attramentaria TaxID=370345 RepID=A0ABD0L4D4_9CAEN